MTSLGFSNAASELALIVFTTLTPIASISCAFIALRLLALKDVNLISFKKLSNLFWLPLLTALLGLIAAAAHLGNPENVLYVLFGVGRSPLSNEVISLVIFLGFTSIYWLYSFSLKPKIAFIKILLLLIVLSALVFQWFVGIAYNVTTIISWNTIYSPLNMWLLSLVGASLFTLVLWSYVWPGELKSTKHRTSIRNLRPDETLLVIVGLLSFIASLIVLPLWYEHIATMRNALVSVTLLLPHFRLFVIAYALFTIVSFGLFVLSKRQAARSKFILSFLACLTMFLGVFVIRWSFYMIHMTAGLAQ
ncbi:MAG: dimethyl sulfoxide reductase anchor subunit [Coriobacteriia bacterium]|nr:dimethyl sulfoxide reductase anchor subunit [Coriobacteriia bacterium]